MNLLNILLMAPPSGGESNPLTSLIPLLLIIVVFYFFMIRPQMRRNKETRKFRENIKRGDKIITIGGLHGKIVEVQETTFTIEVEGGMRIRIEKSAVAANAVSDNLGENK